MRLFERTLTVAALVLIAYSLTPAGTLALFAVGLMLLAAGMGTGSRADNQDVRYGRGRNPRPTIADTRRVR